jgi:hypothetical protein
MHWYCSSHSVAVLQRMAHFCAAAAAALITSEWPADQWHHGMVQAAVFTGPNSGCTLPACLSMQAPFVTNVFPLPALCVLT